MARALIADPDMPRKLLSGRAADVRPCVACNEDCRAFDPVLLCSVNPELGPPGADRRPAAPLVVRRGAEPSGGHVAIVGAGPAGLECAVTLAGRRDVVLFDAATPSAAGSPSRRRLRIAAAGARCSASTRTGSRGWSCASSASASGALIPTAGSVRVIGDALVPRKASHAISEGRAAAEAIGADAHTAVLDAAPVRG